VYIKMSHLYEKMRPNCRDILYENRYILSFRNGIVEIGLIATPAESAGVAHLFIFFIDFSHQIILHNLFYRQTTAGA